MDYLGRITNRSEAPALDLQRWTELISRHPRLAPVEAAIGTNPFTKRSHEYRPHPGAARVIQNGTDVGMMIWAEDGSSQIVVCGTPGVVEEIAIHVAAELGCVFERR